ncbi:hypothetical protein [Salibacterium aidingense]|uniref:hypothetical protein n=1 Tax=Salibacterium aidingense TaxID=384933 RepID=UPI0003F9AAC0|nr:hypothetical protein [Salibacterium aidingense]
MNQTTLSRIKTYIKKREVDIDHNNSSYICIHDQPKEMPHETDRRANRLQDINMMDFQSKVTMLLRANLKENQQQCPLPKGMYRVEIMVETSRRVDELPLLPVMKSVIDSFDREVVANDYDIYQCDIQYRYVGAKTGKTNPDDFLTVQCFDMYSDILLVDFQSVNINIEPKVKPHVLNFDEHTYFFPEHDFYYVSIVDALHQNNIQCKASKTYAVDINFSGSIVNKDIDNMAKVYYPILSEGLGVQEDYITTLCLRKCKTIDIQSCIEIDIQCN